MPSWSQSPLSRRSGSAIGLVLAAHLAFVWLASRPVAIPLAPDDRLWTPLLLPKAVSPVHLQPPAPRVEQADSKAVTASNGGRPAGREAKAPSSVSASTSISNKASSAAPGPTVDEMALPIPSATPSASLLAQALKSAGAIDRQLRAEHPQEFTAPADTPQTRLAKGMAEAHAAVKPGWFEAARMELFSAPNDPKRIYKVITAAGEYCVYYADKGSMSENLSARAGHASFGEARVAPCPTRF